MLLWSRAKCCTKTKAMPGSSSGMAEKNASNADSPPADAPMPTIGNPELCCSDGCSTCSGLTISPGAFAVGFVSAMILSPRFPLTHLFVKLVLQMDEPDRRRIMFQTSRPANLIIERQNPLIILWHYQHPRRMCGPS